MDETLLDDEEEAENVDYAQYTNISKSGNRKTFLDTMLRSENITARETSASNNPIINDGFQSQQKMNGNEDIALKLQLEKKQKEVEEILKRKKDEEHLKRLEFEENRIKKENERMKIAAEEKKKREEDDKRMQIEKEEKNRQEKEKQHLIVDTNRATYDELKAQKSVMMRKKDNQDYEAVEEEEQLRKEEESKIRMGRDQRFRELEEQRRKIIDARMKKESVHVIARNELKLQQQDKIREPSSTETSNDINSQGDQQQGRKSPQPKAVEQYENMVSKMFYHKTYEKETAKQMTEKRNTLDEVTLRIEELDDEDKMYHLEGNGAVESPEDSVEGQKDPSEITKLTNKMIQKPKHAKENEIFRDIINDTGFSISRRWKDVNTGNVKDRANTFTKTEEIENYKSPQIQRKLLKPNSWFREGQKNTNKARMPLPLPLRAFFYA